MQTGEKKVFVTKLLNADQNDGFKNVSFFLY